MRHCARRFVHIAVAMTILCCSTDLPDGNYAALKKSGKMRTDKMSVVYGVACRNYRCALYLQTACDAKACWVAAT